jgi:2-hydroxychromene-2-carboxylate isomerase
MTRPALYLDLGSPYAYLAFSRLRGDVDLVPVLLGAIFARRGHGSWSQTPSRAENVAEVERRAAAYGLPPLVWPPGWPADGLPAMRAATWAAQRGTLDAFAAELFRRQFAEGADIADPAVLAAAAGVEQAELLAAVADPVVKSALRETTDAAWDAGVRGVPTLRTPAGDLRYGDDRI